MNQLSEMLQQRHGLDVSIFDATFLEQSFRKRCAAIAPDDPAAYLDLLWVDRTEADLFLASLRVIHSEFFRDPLAFALLERVVLPSRIAAAKQAQRSELRVWCAGCATGQEAWSMAILLDELTGVLDPALSYRVIATDLPGPDLELARAGSYSAEAVGNVRARHLQTYFSPLGEAFQVNPSLKEQVEFSVFDLLDPDTHCPAASIYGGFDLVLCCNVLLYYRLATQGFILAKLRRGLTPGGYLLVGETERLIVERAGGFRAVAPPATVFQLGR